MKHFLTFFLVGMIGLLSVNMSYSQAVDDRAVVPLSVTLNSILRLNIESGGNVEFNFNTLEQYENGISGLGQNDQYSTKITVASSVDWNLQMGAEDEGLVSTDTVGAVPSMELGYITFQVDLSDGNLTDGTEVNADVTEAALPYIGDDINIIENAGGNAGDVDQNSFRIDWACGTNFNSIGTLMGSNLTGGRYSTNVFFILKPANN